LLPLSTLLFLSWYLELTIFSLSFSMGLSLHLHSSNAFTWLSSKQLFCVMSLKAFFVIYFINARERMEALWTSHFVLMYSEWIL
jgi:hypothetical protein